MKKILIALLILTPFFTCYAYGGFMDDYCDKIQDDIYRSQERDYQRESLRLQQEQNRILQRDTRPYSNGNRPGYIPG